MPWSIGAPALPGWQSFFKSRLGFGIFLRMDRPRLPPGQAELMQPFTDGTWMHVYRVPSLHDAM
jgi:hypothetical protein